MPKRKFKVMDLIGQKFGKLTVLEFDHQLGKRLYYICKCDCGNICVKSNDTLMKNKLAPSCGCIKEDIAKSDIVGQKFNALTVLNFDHMESNNKVSNKNEYYFRCKCDCGNEVILPKSYITTGKVASCRKCNYEKEKVDTETMYTVNFLDNGYLTISDKPNKLSRILNDPRDLVGKMIGRYHILGIAGAKKKDNLSYEYYYICQCSCNRINILSRRYLRIYEGTPCDIKCHFCEDYDHHRKALNKLYCPIRFN